MMTMYLLPYKSTTLSLRIGQVPHLLALILRGPIPNAQPAFPLTVILKTSLPNTTTPNHNMHSMHMYPWRMVPLPNLSPTCPLTPFSHPQKEIASRASLAPSNTMLVLLITNCLPCSAKLMHNKRNPQPKQPSQSTNSWIMLTHIPMMASLTGLAPWSLLHTQLSVF